MTGHDLLGALLLAALTVTACATSAAETPTPEPGTQATSAPETPTAEPTPQVGTIYDGLPDTVDPQRRYVIYLHGRIIEDEGTRPVSPEFGVYEYEETLQALAQAGLEVIAEVRPPNTEGERWASRVVSQVNHLLKGGVPASRITVMGFSKGGGIAIFTSSRLRNERVNFVLIAICGEWVFEWPGVDLHGRVLSVYETSDEYGGSCQSLVEASTGVSGFDELSFSTGKRHGTFYAADPAWLNPVIEWILTEPR